MIIAPDEKPEVTWALLKRVMQYASPYRWHIAGMLSLILVSTGLALLNPLIMRDLIDRTIPSRHLPRLAWLSAALLRVPLAVSGQDAHLPHPPPVRTH